VVGVPPKPEGAIDLPLAKRPAHATGDDAGRQGRGQKALTHYRELDRLAKRQLCWRYGRAPGDASAAVHCAAIGCPILGDGNTAARKPCLPPSPMRAGCIFMPAAVAAASLGQGRVEGHSEPPPHFRRTVEHSAFRRTTIERESGGMRILWRRLVWVLVAAIPLAVIGGSSG